MKQAVLETSIRYGNLKLVQENSEFDIEFLKKIIHAIMSTHYKERKDIIDWLSSHLIPEKLIICIPQIVKKEVKREKKIIKKIRSLLIK